MKIKLEKHSDLFQLLLLLKVNSKPTKSEFLGAEFGIL